MSGAPAARLIVIVTSVALVVGACGGGDDENGAPSPPDEPSGEEAVSGGKEPAPAEEPPPPTEPPPAEAEEPAPSEPAAPAEDPDRELLSYGESFEATLASDEETRQFRFEGEAGDLVRILVDGKDGMDPVVALLEPDRTQIAENDDEGSANRDALIVARLPTDGLQVVRVSAFQGSAGTFVIHIERLSDVDDDGGTIAIGGSVTGSLASDDDIDIYEFAADAGETVRIGVDGAVGVDPFVQLLGPGGGVLRANDDSGHGVDAEIELSLPSTGVYRVEVLPAPCFDRLRCAPRVGPYTFSVVQSSGATAPPEEIAAAMEAVARAYLTALQEGDALTLFALAGPEGLALRGWESADDASLDIAKLQSVGVQRQPLGATSQIEGDRGRVFIEIDTAGVEANETIRFDVVNVAGQWRVDFFERVFVPAAAS